MTYFSKTNRYLNTETMSSVDFSSLKRWFPMMTAKAKPRKTRKSSYTKVSAETFCSRYSLSWNAMKLINYYWQIWSLEIKFPQIPTLTLSRYKLTRTSTCNNSLLNHLSLTWNTSHISAVLLHSIQKTASATNFLPSLEDFRQKLAMTNLSLDLPLSLWAAMEVASLIRRCLRVPQKLSAADCGIWRVKLRFHQKT